MKCCMKYTIYIIYKLLKVAAQERFWWLNAHQTDQASVAEID